MGAANSGAEIALEVAATHRTWLSGPHPGAEPARPGSMFDRILTPPFWFFISRVASVTNPIGRRMRPRMLATTLPLGRVRPKDLDAAGVVRLPKTIAVREGRPVMEDGQIADIGNVIWSTGYRPSFDWVSLDVFDHDGRPVHDRGITAEPGCYFIGLFFLSFARLVIGGRGGPGRRIHRSTHCRTHQLRARLRGLDGCAKLSRGPPQSGPAVVDLACRVTATQNDGALCDVRTPRRQRCSKKLSFMHR